MEETITETDSDNNENDESSHVDSDKKWTEILIYLL
jgi:hypothetical protein